MNLVSHARRLAEPLVLMALRMANTAAKFLLALYTARYLGLAELGVYGLLVGATTLVPAVLGLGTTDWVMRHLVTMPRDEAIASIATRLALPTLLHVVGQPVIWLVNHLLGAPVPWPLLFTCSIVLFLEHIASDTNDLLVGRGRILLANILFFMRAGLWPPIIIVWGLLVPEARTLECLLLGWIGGLALVWITLAAHLFSQRRWRAVGMRLPWIASGVRASVPFYIKDLTGAYTLFWSIANVLHNLTLFSVIQPKLPRLIEAGQKADPTEFRTLERGLQVEAGTWIAVLAVAASIAMLVLLPLLHRPLLYDYLPIFWIVLAATALRAGADGYGFVLLALHRDTAIAVISVAGAIASVTLNLALIPLLGMAGAALAYVITAGGMLAVRYRITRTA